jgi:predicted nucleotidyltransferase component of viral defense system
MEWENLFKKTLDCIDTLPFETKWSFGGGTVLMMQYQHRYSKDIDIFIKDPQIIAYLTPRLNDMVDEITTGKYNEQSNFLKLYLKEGEIDFIVSPSLTENPYEITSILGRNILCETSSEIVAKKVFYRASEFTARDIFDTAFVLQTGIDLVEINKMLLIKRDILLNRIDSNRENIASAISKIHVLPNGEPYLTKSVDVLYNHLLQINQQPSLTTAEKQELSNFTAVVKHYFPEAPTDSIHKLCTVASDMKKLTIQNTNGILSNEKYNTLTDSQEKQIKTITDKDLPGTIASLPYDATAPALKLNIPSSVKEYVMSTYTVPEIPKNKLTIAPVAAKTATEIVSKKR